MAGWGASGALLLVLLIGGSSSLPVKKGGGGGGSDPGGDTGDQTQVVFSQPGEFGGVANPLGSTVYTGPGGRLPAGSYQNLGPAASQDQAWLQEPSGPGDASMLPGHGPGPHSHVLPSGPSSVYQPGELSHMQNVFEHGNYDTETETQGVQGPFLPGVPEPGLPMPVEPDGGIGSLSVSPPFYPGPFNPYPYYDLAFLTGQYPPGTVSHFSSDFEQGRDYYHNAHYNKYYPGDPDGPGDDGQQVKQFPSMPSVPSMPKPGKQKQKQQQHQG